MKYVSTTRLRPFFVAHRPTSRSRPSSALTQFTPGQSSDRSTNPSFTPCAST
jgi:hypothetical protein